MSDRNEGLATDEVGIGFEHPGHKLVGHLHRNVESLSGQRRTPGRLKCARVLAVAHPRTPPHGLRPRPFAQ